MRNFIVKATIPVVLDTNIVMDMLHFGDPRTAALRKAIAGKQIQCCSDSICLAELERVAAYPQFQLSHDEQQALLRAYRDIVALFRREPTVQIDARERVRRVRPFVVPRLTRPGEKGARKRGSRR